MRCLYFCRAYHNSQHGGRTHAREFFAALSKDSRVESARVLPPAPAATDGGQHAKKAAPKPFQRYRDLLRVFIPRDTTTNMLINELRDGGFDTLIVRYTGMERLLYQKIRQALPHVSIALEINSTYIAEEYPANIFYRALDWLECQHFREAHVIFVVSEHLRAHLIDRGLDPARVIVNPNGVDPAVFSPSIQIDAAAMREQFKIPSDALILGYVGGMETFRRLPLLVEQFAELRRRGHKKLFLLIIGAGKDWQAVIDAIAKHHDVLDGWVSTLGWQPHNEVPKLMRLFDIAIFPYTNDYVSPLKLFEYLAMGMATVGPDISGIRGIFLDRQHLRLVSQTELNFVAVMEELLAQPEQMRQLAQQGLQHVVTHYTWQHNVAKFLDGIQAPGASER